MSGYLGPVGQKLPNLEKAEDTAHTTADKGIMALAVRKDTAAALAGSDADYIPLITDATGRLWVDAGAILGVTAAGQAAMAASLPVVIASNQSAVSVADGGGALSVDDAGGNLSIDDGGNVISVDDGAGSLTVDSAQLPAALGQAAMAASLPVVMASDQSSLAIKPDSAKSVFPVGYHVSPQKVAYATVAATATTYASGDLIGTKLTLGTATSESGGGAVLKSVLLVDAANVGPDLAIVIFDADPSSTTFTNDAALAIVAADQPKVVGMVKIAAADWAATAPKIVNVECNLPMQASGSRNFYAAIVAQGAYATGVLANALMITFEFEYAHPA